MFVTVIHVCINIQIEFDIMMRDEDGNSFDEIDNFQIIIPFPSGNNQEEVFIGNRGIANITLSYDIVCIEPNTCTTAVTSSELIGTSIHVYTSNDNTKFKFIATEQLIDSSKICSCLHYRNL